MSTKVQYRRGTTAEHSTFTGAVGEVTIDTDKDTAVVHDGTNAGGRPLLREDLSNLPAGAIDNADINASAAIAGTKISPNFGSQNVVTTGTVTGASLNPTSSTVPTNGVYLPAANSVAISTNGTGRLFVDSSGNVGLGTGAPAASLHVNGSTTVSSQVNVAAQIGANVTSDVLIGSINGNTPFVASQGAYPLQLRTNNAAAITIDSSQRVGVGSTSPGYLLDVAGSARIGATDTSAVTLEIGTGATGNRFASVDLVGDTTYSDYGLRINRNNTGANATSQINHRGLGALEVKALEAAPISFFTSNAERARIDSSGRLLLGTPTARANFENATIAPQVQVEGLGFDTASFSITRNLVTTTPGQGGGIHLARSGASSFGSNTLVASGNGLGYITFSGADGTEFVPAASIRAEVDGTPGANDMPGRIVLSTTASGASSPTERMRIDRLGRVGIGAVSTAAMLNARLSFEDAIVAGFRTDSVSLTSSVSEAYHFIANGATTGVGGSITSQYGYFAGSSLTTATNNYGFYSAIASGTGRYGFYAAGTAPNYFAGKIASLGSYNDTTASAANVFIASNGDIQRSTSSIRYKTDIETLEQSYADNVILNARPVWYRSLCEADNAGWSYYGLIAEEVAELDPRLVFWGRPTKEVISEEAKPAVFDDDGNEIEPAREAVYTNVEDTDAELRPEGVQYDRLTVMLIDVVQRQQKTIEALEARVAALEAN